MCVFLCSSQRVFTQCDTTELKLNDTVDRGIKQLKDITNLYEESTGAQELCV